MEESAESTETATTDLSNWKGVVALVPAELGERRMEEEATCQAVVLTPKGGRDNSGICLVEAVCNVLILILN